MKERGGYENFAGVKDSSELIVIAALTVFALIGALVTAPLRRG
jgi:hypothetical protein